jgi:apolipoprotein N-acyltransferase
MYCVLWFGGCFIEQTVQVNPFAISALLVQPHPEELTASCHALHRQTLESISEDGQADLILWGEGSIQGRTYSELSNIIEPKKRDFDPHIAASLTGFREQLHPQYDTVCLVGVIFDSRTANSSSGEGDSRGRKLNCAVLVSSSIVLPCHEKIALMPLRERPIYCLRWFPGLHRWLFPEIDVGCYYEQGRDFCPLTFRDRCGAMRRIAVAICYESWLPWLPQYHCEEPLDAICHLAYDGDFKDHPEYTQRMLLTIRLRAIETRTWQLVCSHYAGTAVIDPRGRIVKQLPPGPGVLRTDQL